MLRRKRLDHGQTPRRKDVITEGAPHWTSSTAALAPRTITRSTLADEDAFHLRFAARTRLAFAAIGQQLALEPAFFAVRVAEVLNARPTRANGVAQHLLNRCMQRFGVLF